MRRRCAWAVAAAALVVSEAGAQERLTSERLIFSDESTIQQRFNREFGAPPAMRLGTFTLRSSVTEVIGYEDNVFAAKDKQDAIGSITQGNSTLTTNWKRHQAFVAADAAFLAYANAKFRDQDAWAGSVASGGQLDVTRDVKTGIAVSATRRLQTRGDPDSINAAAEPVLYEVYNAEPWLRATTGRFTHSLAVQGETTTYPNATTSTGAPINLAALEYSQVQGGYRLGYVYLDPYEIFLRVSAQDRNSTNNAGIPVQNFTVMSAAVGIDVRLSPVLGAVLAGGVQHVTNDNPLIGDADVPTFDLRLGWTPVESLQLDARVARDFATSIVTGGQINSPGYVRTFGSLSAVSEIRHGLIGTAGAYVINRDFIDSSTDQLVYGVDIGLRYALGEGLIVGANYLWRYESQDSEYTYSRNFFLTRITKTF